MTNKLLDILSGYTLSEGTSVEARYDVMVKNYDGQSKDLLIEVKSSAGPANIRMAVGQLYSYWFGVGTGTEIDVAILLPKKPSAAILEFLEWMGIGALWFSRDSLKTNTKWLVSLTEA